MNLSFDFVQVNHTLADWETLEEWEVSILCTTNPTRAFISNQVGLRLALAGTLPEVDTCVADRHHTFICG